MQLQFHHFFVFVSKDAPVVDYLQQQGFSEGSRNRHPGQGTANRRIFFQNGMLEFIWAENLVELQSPRTARTRLGERSQHHISGFSPFGIGLCPASHTDMVIAEPFVGWVYRPQYLPPEYTIWEAENASYPWEPMIFYLPFAKLYDSNISKTEPIQHPNGVQCIESITVTIQTPTRLRSDAAQKLASVDRIALVAGDKPFAEIKMMGDNQTTLDLTPWCPVKIIL